MKREGKEREGEGVKREGKERERGGRGEVVKSLRVVYIDDCCEGSCNKTTAHH